MSYARYGVARLLSGRISMNDGKQVKFKNIRGWNEVFIG